MYINTNVINIYIYICYNKYIYIYICYNIYIYYYITYILELMFPMRRTPDKVAFAVPPQPESSLMHLHSNRSRSWQGGEDC